MSTSSSIAPLTWQRIPLTCSPTTISSAVSLVILDNDAVYAEGLERLGVTVAPFY